MNILIEDHSLFIPYISVCLMMKALAVFLKRFVNRLGRK